MPLYTFRCDKCELTDERFLFLKEFGKRQACLKCSRTMRRVITPCTLRTDTNFMKNSTEDDGFGADNWSRQQALRMARAAGVSVTGKKFHPGLCRPGMAFDPMAWYSDRGEVVAKAEKLGRNVNGSMVNHKTSVRDSVLRKEEEDDNDYRPSADAVKDDVLKEIALQHGGRVTGKKAREITEKYRDRFKRPKPNRNAPKLEDLLCFKDK